jgi:alkylhydroperoxidase/carboxymuconolactone decarboxylase family protein YurZ
MAISAAAKGNHDQLFGDRVSTLAQSDPELIEYFDNFAFDEVYADAARLDETLGLHTRLMVQLAAILAAGGLAEFRVVAAAAVANGGVGPVELKEIVYQSIAYVGMARAYELLTFSMLVALGGADAQVRGHVNGNLRVGNTRARLLAVLTVLVPFIGYPRTLNGLAALNDITRS